MAKKEESAVKVDATDIEELSAEIATTIKESFEKKIEAEASVAEHQSEALAAIAAERAKQPLPNIDGAARVSRTKNGALRVDY